MARLPPARQDSGVLPQGARLLPGEGGTGAGLLGGGDYYRVRTDTEGMFDLYYDRAPQGPGRRKGG